MRCSGRPVIPRWMNWSQSVSTRSYQRIQSVIDWYAARYTSLNLGMRCSEELVQPGWVNSLQFSSQSTVPVSPENGTSRYAGRTPYQRPNQHKTNEPRSSTGRHDVVDQWPEADSSQFRRNQRNWSSSPFGPKGKKRTHASGVPSPNPNRQIVAQSSHDHGRVA